MKWVVGKEEEEDDFGGRSGRLGPTCSYQLQSGCTYTNMRLVVGRSVGECVDQQQQQQRLKALFLQTVTNDFFFLLFFSNSCCSPASSSDLLLVVVL
jgi:hypothetical protein